MSAYPEAPFKNLFHARAGRTVISAQTVIYHLFDLRLETLPVKEIVRTNAGTRYLQKWCSIPGDPVRLLRFSYSYVDCGCASYASGTDHIKTAVG
jgi:hypothetical protein